MNNILYIVAVVLIILWVIGYFGFHAGDLIHILIFIAVVAVLVRIIKGNRPLN